MPWVRCKLCKIVGYVRHGVLSRRPGKLSPKSVTPFVCSTNGCSKHAVERLHGVGTGARHRWACLAHKPQ